MKTISRIISVFIFLSLQLNAQETWTCYTDDDALLMDDHIVKGMFDYKDGSLWIVTNKGINIFKDGSWKIINKKSDLLKNKIGSYMIDSKDRIWIGTGSPDIFFDGYALGHLYEGGVVIYDGDEWKPLQTEDLGIKAPVITRMYEASNGDVWMGMSAVSPGAERGALFPKGALLRLAAETEEWTIYKGKDMPCIDCHFIKGFYEDENNRVHFFADFGIFYFEDDAFHSIRKDHEEFNFSRGNYISARFTDSNNNLWLGAPARIARHDGKNWRSFNRKNGLPSMDNPPYGFAETSNGKIIMTAVNGVYTYDNEDQWVKEKMKLLTGNSYIDGQGRHWIPSLKGLIIRDGENETLHKNIPKVWRVLKDTNDGIWAITRNKGIHRYMDGQWQAFNKDNQLPSDRVTMFFTSSNGAVWIGTNKGICSCEYD